MIRRTALAITVTLAALPSGAQTLTGAEWRVVELGGIATPAEGAPTIAFAAEGRLSGHSGCNRYMGGWVQDGAALTLTGLGMTRMACPGDRMDLERRMVEALGAVTAAAITPGGALELLGAQGLLLRAVRP